MKRSMFILNLRNSLNIRSIPIMLPNDMKSYSISDAFCWRNSKIYTTNFHFTDLINYFQNEKNTSVDLIISNHKNQIINQTNITPSNFSEKIKIKDYLIDSKETSGHFFFFHNFTHPKRGKIIIRNSCYTSFSFMKNTPSFVHGNLPVIARDHDSLIYKKNIIQNSNFRKYIDKVQHDFSTYDKVEAFIINPLKEELNLMINKTSLNLNPYNSKILNLKLSKTYKIKSNCLFLRPIFFVYKNGKFDTFHG